jgi:hypothetical protein
LYLFVVVSVSQWPIKGIKHAVESLNTFHRPRASIKFACDNVNCQLLQNNQAGDILNFNYELEKGLNVAGFQADAIWVTGLSLEPRKTHNIIKTTVDE